MPGLPFGAAQQHGVPEDVRGYDGIVGIEFVEFDADLPCPRSVAYRRVDGGAGMRVRANAPEIAQFALSEQQARAYLDTLAASGLFSWQRVYRPAQGTFVNASTQWRLEVTFARRKGQARVRPFRVEGENVFPDDYEAVLELLMAPAGGACAVAGEQPCGERG